MKLRLSSHMRRKGIQLGRPGAIGAGGLVMCLALYFSIVQPAQQRLDTVRLSVSSLHGQTAQARRATKEGARPLDEQLAAFYGIFPSEHDATDWVGKIAVIAQRDGLNLQQAEYKAERDKTGKLTRFQMSLPLKGEYQTIRRFLSDLRAEIPIVSLEQVQFERQKVGDPLVDAKVRLVIYLGKPS
ncbi:type 4a pilus biogenesis protein PilO [Rhodoferax ferrireducens]|uniref:type 4a pilus biogenesis protein PilO n=1 Tax=Rhodoferax ferrireducens TaxID=192843 RepID=UPI001300910C|nr:type 4a pilus biogenesis protein PilO [Rhodoferax ferrireducens]